MTAATSAAVRQLLRAEPVDLDPVTTGIAARVGHRGCLRCPRPARVAYIADCWPYGERWLDLCPWCASWFRAELDQLVSPWGQL